MSFINTASPDTVRAYRLDLRQAFVLSDNQMPTVDEIFQTQKAPSALSQRTAQALHFTEDLLEICRKAVSRWGPLSAASKNRKISTLKSLLGWLHSQGLIDRDLAGLLHATKVPYRLPHFVSMDEVLALLHFLRQKEKAAGSESERCLAQRDLALVLLLYGGGLRVSEACHLRWANLSSDAQTMRITGKGGRERIAALPLMAAQVLLKYRRSHNGAFVFGSEPLPTRQAYEIVRRSAAQAGLLKPLHPHALRHSFATHLLSSGANLRTLQELLGHRTLQATQRYTHLNMNQLAQTLETCHPLGQTASRRKNPIG